MDEKASEARSKFTMESINSIPIVALMEKSHLPWGIKDNQSRFVYLNKASKENLNIPHGFDFEGRTDDEFPCLWSSLAEEYQIHDRKAEKTPVGAEIITTSFFGRDERLEPLYCPKFPIYSEVGETLGTIYYTRKFNYLSIFNLFEHIKPSVITLTPSVDIFTERELEIIFYAIQKMSAKEIAPMLCISHRTVENRLLKIYEKADTNSIKGLIEYCHNVGLNNYVPKKLLREGVNFCW